MVGARMGVWGKGQQSLAPPQYTETPEREQRFGLQPGSSQLPGDPTRLTEISAVANMQLFVFFFCHAPDQHGTSGIW